MTNLQQVTGRGTGLVRGFSVELFDDGFCLQEEGGVVLRRRYPGLSLIEQPEVIRFLLAEVRAWAHECRITM